MTSTRKPQFELALLIHDLSLLSDQVYELYMKPSVRITRPQLWILLNLAENDGEGMMQAELARHLGVRPIGLGKMIDRLEISGVVRRVPDKVDRRTNRIMMTAKGRNILGNVEKLGVVEQGLLVRGIPPDDIEDLIAKLRLLKSSMSWLCKVGPKKKGAARNRVLSSTAI